MRNYLLLVLFLLTGSISAQTTRNVPSQYSTIQAAVNAAQSGDTVLVQPGIYYEQINISSKVIYIASKILTSNDTSFISNTIIDGNRLGTVVTFTYTNTTLDGFTIRNGSANWGGGIYISRASPTLKNLHIVNNIAQIEGGGVYANNEGGNGTVVIDKSIIDSNSATTSAGGGLALRGANIRLKNSIISRNWANDIGGGLALWWDYQTDPSLVSKIDSCRFTENYSAGSGGGLFIFRSNPLITNTTINRNKTGSEGAGLAASEGYGTIVISNSIIDSNSNAGTTNAGGGIALRGANIRLTNSVISRNIADNVGGGLALWWDYQTDPSLVSKIDSCRFTENYSAGSGGGLFIFRSNPLITNTTINRNIAGYEGGGFAVSNEGGNGTVVIDKSIIDSNSTSPSGGGGLSFRGASLSLTNSVISRNSTNNISGGMLFSNCIQINLAYNTIIRNTATNGGAIGFDTPLNGSMVNSILWGNYPNEIYSAGGNFQVSNSDIKGGWLGSGNFSADPKFTDSLSYQLSSSSPCISKAKDIDTIKCDLRGNIRPNPDGTYSDIGALESPYGFLRIDTTTVWRMKLEAAISIYQDLENYAGVADTATDNQDIGFDTPEPPASPGSYISLFFPHPEWGSILGNNFAKDIKKNTSLADTVKRWYFQVISNVVNDTVTLTFVNDRIPSTFGKYLTDSKTGKRVNLNNTSLYKYFNTSDTARSFILTVGDTTAPSLALISPNGSNTWRSKTTKNITWSTSDGTGIDSVFVYSSSNGGSSYLLLKSLGSVQSTSWIVPSEYLNNNYSIKIVSRDSLGNQSTTRSAKTFTVIGDSLATVNSPGWSLINSPLTPNDSSIANIFDATSYLWYYTQATGYTQPSKIALGNGYWLGVTASKNWFVKGTASEADSSVQNLQIGYNIIGNYFVRNVSKSNLFFLKAGSYYNFNSAVSAGLISNTLYGYSSSAYSSIDTMLLFDGYWIGVLQSGVQLIQKPNVSVVAPLAKQTQINAMNWDLPMSVSTPSLADNIAAIGIKPTSTADFDPQYDAPRPPRNPGSKYLEMYSTNTGGNYPAILGSKYAKDYRGSDNPQWSFTVESSEIDSVTTIQWDPNVLKQLGANVRLALTDQIISKSIDMAIQASYSFDYNSPRIFTITSTITGVNDNSPNKPTSYALRQNFPNPFNPSTQIEFSIPQSSHVTLKIYDVLGKEVASLVDCAMGVGTYTTTWNAQNCPSGVYFYRLTAVSYSMTRKLVLMR